MTEVNLQQRFPDLKPVSHVPPLGSILGFGFRLSYPRDYDETTGSYLTSYCLMALLVPILCLRVYRAVATDAGIVILGREPLKGGAKLWNLVVLGMLVMALGLLWWKHYSHTPEYIARREISKAEQLVKQGELADGARLLCGVAAGRTGESTRPIDALAALLERRLRDVPPDEAASTLAAVVELAQSNKASAAKLSPLDHGFVASTRSEERAPSSKTGVAYSHTGGTRRSRLDAWPLNSPGTCVQRCPIDMPAEASQVEGASCDRQPFRDEDEHGLAEWHRGRSRSHGILHCFRCTGDPCRRRQYGLNDPGDSPRRS